MIIPSVELIMGLVGSTIGVVICIVYPAACFRKIVQKHSIERQLAYLIIVAGFILMILGTYANLHAIDAQSSGAKRVEMSQDNMELPRVLPREDTFDGQLHFEGTEGKVLEDKAKQEKESRVILLPPLPVDEFHHPPQILKYRPSIEVQMNADSAPFPSPRKPSEKKEFLESNVKKEVPSSSPIPSLKKEVDAVKSPLNLDKEAIKKDEEVTKEEIKKTAPEVKIDDHDALQKTKKELEETKDLLEKSVKELKAELVKQNQETQQLVEEKLGEVVEKFQQLERRKILKVVEEKAPELLKDENPKIEVKENHKELRVNLTLSRDSLPPTKLKEVEKEVLIVPAPSNLDLIKKNLQKGVPLPLAFGWNNTQQLQSEKSPQQLIVVPHPSNASAVSNDPPPPPFPSESPSEKHSGPQPKNEV